jgi:hypothetical protein
MGILADKIREVVRENRHAFGAHADQRLRDRRIVGWQVVAGLDAATLVRERPRATPNPIAEFDHMLADGTQVRAVRSWISSDRTAKLVTVHFTH